MAELEITESQARKIAQRTQAAGIVRPTPPPFDWAQGIFTFGVTGTNGKTSTTHLLAHLLGAADSPVLSKTTVDCTIGSESITAPASLRGFLQTFYELAQRQGSIASVEVTSHALAKGYAKFWRFDVGVFTNLSRDHLKDHGSWEHYLASKAQLFVHLPDEGCAVLNAADEAALMIDRVVAPSVERIWYGNSEKKLLRSADLVIKELSVDQTGTHFEFEPSALAERMGTSHSLSFVGDVYAENAAAALAAASHREPDGTALAGRLLRAPILPGRFQVVHRSPLCVVDYAHSPDALLRLCQTARRVAPRGRLIVVFGAGGGADPEKRLPMGEAIGSQADYAFVTNDNPRFEAPEAIASVLMKGVRRGGRAYGRSVLDRREAIERAVALAKSDDVVLVAGKGHERGQQVRDETLPFSDIDELSRLLGQPS